MTAHEKAILTYEALQRRKEERKKGKWKADSFRYTGMKKNVKNKYRDYHSRRMIY